MYTVHSLGGKLNHFLQYVCPFRYVLGHADLGDHPVLDLVEPSEKNVQVSCDLLKPVSAERQVYQFVL